MTAAPQIDAETLAVGYLAQSAAGDLCSGVATALPRGWTPDDPRLRVTRLGGLPDPRDPIGHVNRARLQIDAFAPSSSDAYELAAQALADLENLPSSGFETPGVVVTAVRQSVGIARQDDPRTGGPRYFLEVILYAHRAPV